MVTGAAGFIGSHLVDSLLAEGSFVVGIDNFSTGRQEFLADAFGNPNFILKNLDLLDELDWNTILKDVSRIYHFSANADVRFGGKYPTRDFEQNTLVTKNVLEAARKYSVNEFVFSSTGSVYGEAKIIPTAEDTSFPIQTSLYGASKLASEGMIQAYSETFGIRSWIFRFVSILGPRYSHGHVFDFFKQLTFHPTYLDVLGNGQQKKSYLHVSDCIRAIEKATQKPGKGVEIYNLGTDEYCSVIDSIGWIVDELGVKPTLNLGTESKGWVGDNPFIYLDTKKIRSLGWEPEMSIEQGIRETLRYLIANPFPDLTDNL